MLHSVIYVLVGYIVLKSIMSNFVELKDSSSTLIFPRTTYRVSMPTAGTQTIELPTGMAYLIVITRANTSNSTYTGMWIAHPYPSGGAASLKEISSSAAATLSLSNTTLTVTTTQNYCTVRILPL